jgi:EAL domain-containing protein (putative c-di-GMP-specific phosphodiesterase class I)
VRPGQIELDLPESAVLNETADITATLQELRKLGVRLSIDDFGAGRCSLFLLRRLPMNGLKIDRSLVRELATNPDTASIVSALIGLARSFNLQVTAEGVETNAQREMLLAEGCQLAQGYLYAPALAAQHAENALATGRLGPV